MSPAATKSTGSGYTKIRALAIESPHELLITERSCFLAGLLSDSVDQKGFSEPCRWYSDLTPKFNPEGVPGYADAPTLGFLALAPQWQSRAGDALALCRVPPYGDMTGFPCGRHRSPPRSSQRRGHRRSWPGVRQGE